MCECSFILLSDQIFRIDTSIYGKLKSLLIKTLPYKVNAIRIIKWNQTKALTRKNTTHLDLNIESVVNNTSEMKEFAWMEVFVVVVNKRFLTNNEFVCENIRAKHLNENALLVRNLML